LVVNKCHTRKDTWKYKLEMGIKAKANQTRILFIGFLKAEQTGRVHLF